jgi:hypothetical protein
MVSILRRLSRAMQDAMQAGVHSVRWVRTPIAKFGLCK